MFRVSRLPAGPRLLVWALCLLWGMAGVPMALAKATTAASAPPLTSLAVQSGAALSQPPGRIVVMNREIVTLRGSLFGIVAVTRAAEGEERIRKALRRGGDLKVESTQIAEGVLVAIDGALVFAVTPDDSEERTLAGARARPARPRRCCDWSSIDRASRANSSRCSPGHWSPWEPAWSCWC